MRWLVLIFLWACVDQYKIDTSADATAIPAYRKRDALVTHLRLTPEDLELWADDVSLITEPPWSLRPELPFEAPSLVGSDPSAWNRAYDVARRHFGRETDLSKNPSDQVKQGFGVAMRRLLVELMTRAPQEVLTSFIANCVDQDGRMKSECFKENDYDIAVLLLPQGNDPLELGQLSCNNARLLIHAGWMPYAEYYFYAWLDFINRFAASEEIPWLLLPQETHKGNGTTTWGLLALPLEKSVSNNVAKSDVFVTSGSKFLPNTALWFVGAEVAYRLDQFESKLSVLSDADKREKTLVYKTTSFNMSVSRFREPFGKSPKQTPKANTVFLTQLHQAFNASDSLSSQFRLMPEPTQITYNTTVYLAPR